jgi:inorganic pyrophosphatase
MAALSGIPAGDKLPESFNVIIEIPADGKAIKYEVDKDTGLLVVDRFMPTAMHYPADYGYVPSTLAGDGDPVDVLVITPEPVQAGCLIKCRALGMLTMTDEAGEDNKVLAVPVAKSCAEFAHMKSLGDVSSIALDRIVHFFTYYKALEPNKWVKVEGWKDQAAAHQEIQSGVANYQG